MLHIRQLKGLYHGIRGTKASRRTEFGDILFSTRAEQKCDWFRDVRTDSWGDMTTTRIRGDVMSNAAPRQFERYAIYLI